MASGFSGQKFAFHGYLPIDKIDRAKEIKNLEQQSAREKQTQIFIETPFRNNQLLADLLKICKPSSLLCVASNVTAADENIQSLTIGEWRKRSYDYHKKPTIFLLYA